MYFNLLSIPRQAGDRQTGRRADKQRGTGRKALPAIKVRRWFMYKLRFFNENVIEHADGKKIAPASSGLETVTSQTSVKCYYSVIGHGKTTSSSPYVIRALNMAKLGFLYGKHIPANIKYLYNICTLLDQRRRRWVDVVQMLYKCFVFAGCTVHLPGADSTFGKKGIHWEIGLSSSKILKLQVSNIKYLCQMSNTYVQVI